ncbi:MAG: tetratricopeptide repeat protein [Candidatus Krumholzibacteriia bacterium]
MPRLCLVCVLLAAATAAVADSPVLWDQLDWRLERSVLVSRYLFHDRQPADPWALYTRTLGPDETPLADLLAEFRALAPEARQRATRAAEERLANGRLALLDCVYPLRDAVENREPNLVGDVGEPTPGFAEATGKAIELFADAVRRDPTLAEAWYHLAFFTDLAGDRARSARARAAFFSVWPEQDAGTRESLAPLRELAVLDQAWSLRDAGRYDECTAWLDREDAGLSVEATPPGVAPATEARLIRALCAAEQGNVSAALGALPSLPLMALPHRASAPLQSYVPVGLQESYYRQRFGDDTDPHHNPAPTWQEDPVDNLARERRDSSYLRRWVKAWTSLRRGYEAETVRRDLGRVETELEFQPRLAWRWWQDQGLIHEALGDPELARVCWARAAVYRPLFIYQPTGQGQGLAGVHGLGGTGEPYFLGYGTFFLAGSVWGYAANAELASEVETGALERQVLRRLAGEALDVCERRGFRPIEARALRGRLAFLDEDYASAWDLLLGAWEALEPQQAAPSDLALMLGLCRFNSQDWTAAEPWLQTFTQRSPEAPVGWLTLGLDRAMLGRDEAAFVCLDRAVALAPDDATALYNRGLLHYRLRRRDAARADFLRAQALWPDNPQIAQMVGVVGEETEYDLQVTAAPMHVDLPEAQRRRLAELLAAGRTDASAGELADLAAAGPDQRDRLLAGLEQRYRDRPDATSRTRLAQALLLAGEPDRVQALLAPSWPDQLQPVERRLLLYADRTTGEISRAVEVAGSARWADRQTETEFLLLAATILLEHDHQAEARQVVRRGLAQDPSNAALRDLERSLERSP